MNLNSLLEQYFTLHQGMPIGCVTGSDPTRSTIARSGPTNNVMLMCDIGVCLAALNAEHQAAIWERWRLWLEREEINAATGRHSDHAMSAMRAGRRGGMYRARRNQKRYEMASQRITKAIRRHEGQSMFIDAMSILIADVKSRNERAIARNGNRVAFSGVHKKST